MFRGTTPNSKRLVVVTAPQSVATGDHAACDGGAAWTIADRGDAQQRDGSRAQLMARSRWWSRA